MPTGEGGMEGGVGVAPAGRSRAPGLTARRRQCPIPGTRKATPHLQQLGAPLRLAPFPRAREGPGPGELLGQTT